MKPIYNSLGFLIGGFFTLFIVWAWMDSMHHATRFGYRQWPKGLEIELDRSLLRLSASLGGGNRIDRHASAGEWFWNRRAAGQESEAVSAFDRWLPEFDVVHILQQSGHYVGPQFFVDGPQFEADQYSIPYWALVVAWLGLWLGGLFGWRHLRRKRLACNSS